jgi:hypothetical protein
MASLLFAPLFGCEGDTQTTKVGGTALVDSGPLSSGDEAPPACDDTGIDPATAELPCDVAAILATRCQRCHDTAQALESCLGDGGCLKGPFPLRSWADTRELVGSGIIFERMKRAVEVRFMPLRTMSVAPPVILLTDEEIATIVSWVDDCAPPRQGASCVQDAALSDSSSPGDAAADAATDAPPAPNDAASDGP